MEPQMNDHNERHSPRRNVCRGDYIIPPGVYRVGDAMTVNDFIALYGVGVYLTVVGICDLRASVVDT